MSIIPKPNKLLIKALRTIVWVLPKKVLKEFIMESLQSMVATVHTDMLNKMEPDEDNIIAAMSLGQNADGKVQLFFSINTLKTEQVELGKVPDPDNEGQFITEYGERLVLSRELHRQNVNKMIENINPDTIGDDMDKYIDQMENPTKELPPATETKQLN